MPVLIAIAHITVLLIGFWLVATAVFSAVKTFVVPRGEQDFIVVAVFRLMLLLFRIRLKRTHLFAARDRVYAYYAPLSLLLLMVIWLILIAIGYSAIFWAIDGHSLLENITLSGSSLLTLGFASSQHFPVIIVSFSEATIGLIMIAILIAYLPTIYSTYSKREAMVTLLEVRAGSPPSATNMILRYNRFHGLDHLAELWEDWELWFAELNETHTSLPMLNFFRSPKADRSWITAAGTVLDCAALTLSILDIPPDPHCNLCLRAGFVALRDISAYFDIAYDPDPRSTDPISITRAEFDAVYDQFLTEGVPIRSDREQAWHDFVGWRVNYDTVLLDLAQFIVAPIAPWSSDRPPQRMRIPAIVRQQQ